MWQLKKFSLYLGSAILFSLIFWLVGFFLWRTLSANTSTDSSQEIARNEQDETYRQQLLKADQQLEVTAAQQKRMDELLSRQEKQADRYDAVLKKWEGRSQ